MGEYGIKPIIFSADDVRATLDGRKTKTWEMVTMRKGVICALGNGIVRSESDGAWYPADIFKMPTYGKYLKQPYRPGDILWVREIWSTTNYRYIGDGKWGADIKYKDELTGPMVSWYDNSAVGIPYDGIYAGSSWRSPVCMPREATRLCLRVTGVEPKQIKNITNNEAKMMGFRGGDFDYYSGYISEPFDDFVKAWYKKRSKSSPNDWVWLIDFEKYTT